MSTRSRMVHEADIPPRALKLAMRALWLAGGAFTLAGGALSLCLAHHG